jgi:hypothetical protein
MYKVIQLPNSLYIIVSDKEIDVEDIAFDTDTKELFQVIGFGHAGLIRSQTDTYIADACKKVVCTTEKFTYAPAKYIPLGRIKALLSARAFTTKDMEAMYLLGQQVGVNQLLSRRGELVNHHLERADYTAPAFEEIIFPKDGVPVYFDETGSIKLI